MVKMLEVKSVLICQLDELKGPNIFEDMLRKRSKFWHNFENVDKSNYKSSISYCIFQIEFRVSLHSGVLDPPLLRFLCKPKIDVLPN